MLIATHFVVFDACRNTLKLTNLASRAVVQSKGFVPVAQENGMLIAYATAEGELASDVGTEAGPYAKVLAAEIVKPGREAFIGEERKRAAEGKASEEAKRIEEQQRAELPRAPRSFARRRRTRGSHMLVLLR